MARIYRKSDRIKVRIDDVTLSLAPLSAHERAEIQTAMMESYKDSDIKKGTEGVVLALRYSIKEIQGVYVADGSPYKLQFDELGNLTRECVDDLLNLGITEKMSMVCASLAKRVPPDIADERGNKLEGVELVDSDKESNEKNLST